MSETKATVRRWQVFTGKHKPKSGVSALEVVRLRDVEGLSISDIALRLGVTPEAVIQRYRRTHAALKEGTDGSK